jgi:hypothetical protein
VLVASAIHLPSGSRWQPVSTKLIILLSPLLSYIFVEQGIETGHDGRFGDLRVTHDFGDAERRQSYSRKNVSQKLLPVDRQQAAQKKHSTLSASSRVHPYLRGDNPYGAPVWARRYPSMSCSCQGGSSRAISGPRSRSRSAAREAPALGRRDGPAQCMDMFVLCGFRRNQ